MGTMLYTKDAELAVTVALRPKKGVFDGTKVACFYHTFEDDDVAQAKAAGWVDFQTLLGMKAKPEEPEKAEEPAKLVGRKPLVMKRVGHGDWQVIDADGYILAEGITKAEAEAMM